MKGGLGSPSHLKMVIEGERNLSPKSIAKYNKALGLISDDEKKYFELLIKHDHEKQALEKEKLFAEIRLKQKSYDLSILEQDQLKFLSQWYCVCIYVLLSNKKYGENTHLIEKRLSARVSKLQISEALDLLLELKLIKKDEDGVLIQNSGHISTSDKVQSIAIQEYHRQMANLSLLALTNLEVNQREFDGVTVAVDQKKLQLIKEKTRKLRDEINSLCSDIEDSDEVWQLNLQLFPLTTIGDKND